MTDDQQIPLDDIRLEGDRLYREEIFTDLRVGTLRRFSPVKQDGTPDTTRTPVYSGETQLMSQGGPIPVTAPIEANTLAEAIAAFPDAIQAAVQRMVEEVRELQRRESSRIVVPGREQKGKIELP